QPRPERVRRKPGRGRGVEVGDERRDWHSLELAGERGRQRENVVHDDAGRVSAVARTTASYGFNGRARVGNTGYSGAGANCIPAASTHSRQRDQVSKVTSC